MPKIVVKQFPILDEWPKDFNKYITQLSKADKKIFDAIRRAK